MPKSKEYVSSSNESSGSETEVKEKKRKKENTEKEKPSSKKAKKEEKKNDDNSWELGNNRFVSVREFKGRTLIDIREMYMDKETGELKPGSKGISLSVAQFNKFVESLDDVKEAVKKL